MFVEDTTWRYVVCHEGILKSYKSSKQLEILGCQSGLKNKRKQFCIEILEERETKNKTEF